MKDAPAPSPRPRPHPRPPAAPTPEILEITGPAPRRDLLIEYLHALQDRHGHIPAAALRSLAGALRLAPTEVYEVASFYSHFDAPREGEPPPPPLTVRVCASLSCELAGARALAEALRGALGAGVRVQEVSCVGRCEQAPVAVVGTNPIGQADAAQVAAAVQAGETTAPPPRHADLRAYSAAGGYRVWRQCLAGEREREAVFAALETADLRGLGGAGFPTARKWRLVAAQPAPRYLAVNADEGEPGTFKDRECLESDPHRFLEGALIAAWAVGAEAVYIYLRDEYAAARSVLEAELEALAQSFAGELPELHLRRGAGAYICGEESAMIESLEGRRGIPRLRPPYVAERGLFGRPTLVNNVETLHRVRENLEAGPEIRAGLLSFSVSGRVARPGLYRARAGISARELIEEHAGGMAPGHALYAYLPGGASGGILPARLADLPLDFGTLEPHGGFIGSAALIALSESDRARDAALNLMRFFAHESCGQCTPCRAGTARAVSLLEIERPDAGALRELAQIMRDASICGLGQAAANPIDCLLRYFPGELGLAADNGG